MTLLVRSAYFLSALGFCSLRGTLAAAQQPPAPDAPPSAPYEGAASPAPAACVPACRAGYLCHEGRCISMCNPPCPEGSACVDGLRCEPAGGPPRIYEPPPPPPPPSFSDRAHSALAFHSGLGGSVRRDEATTDLGTTLGFNLRSDIPVARYLLIGPLFQFGAWRPDLPGQTPSRSYIVDIDLFVRGRIPIELDPVALQIWGGVPVGLSLSFLRGERAPELETFGLGWNVGVLFGGAIHFGKRFGIFAEGGWLRHRMSHDHAEGGGRAAFRLAQAQVNAGFIFSN